MSDVFLSYVEEDAEIAREIASGLEAAGYTAWYYHRDSVPGAYYLTQAAQAIETAPAFLLLISPDSIISGQVDKEVILAHEFDKVFVPVLRGLTHAEAPAARASAAAAGGERMSGRGS